MGKQTDSDFHTEPWVHKNTADLFLRRPSLRNSTLAEVTTRVLKIGLVQISQLASLFFFPFSVDTINTTTAFD